MRIKNMPRFIISMSVLFILIVSLISMITTKVFSYEKPVYEKIVVSKGDTLWEIASNLKGNIHKNIYHIQEINHLEDANLYIGQELFVPKINNEK